MEIILRPMSGIQALAATSTLRIESERIDAAMNLVGELIIQRSMIATLAGDIEQLDPRTAATTFSRMIPLLVK